MRVREGMIRVFPVPAGVNRVASLSASLCVKSSPCLRG